MAERKMKDWICANCEHLKFIPGTRWEPSETVCTNKKSDFYDMPGADGECTCFKAVMTEEEMAFKRFERIRKLV